MDEHGPVVVQAAKPSIQLRQEAIEVVGPHLVNGEKDHQGRGGAGSVARRRGIGLRADTDRRSETQGERQEEARVVSGPRSCGVHMGRPV